MIIILDEPRAFFNSAPRRAVFRRTLRRAAAVALGVENAQRWRVVCSGRKCVIQLF